MQISMACRITQKYEYWKGKIIIILKIINPFRH